MSEPRTKMYGKTFLFGFGTGSNDEENFAPTKEEPSSSPPVLPRKERKFRRGSNEFVESRYTIVMNRRTPAFLSLGWFLCPSVRWRIVWQDLGTVIPSWKVCRQCSQRCPIVF